MVANVDQVERTNQIDFANLISNPNPSPNFNNKTNVTVIVANLTWFVLST